MTRKRWLWITFSIALVVLLGTLGTSYNVALVQDYRKMVEFARTAHLFDLSIPDSPKWNVLWGTLGFLTALFGIVIFLLKILREMQLNQTQSDFIDRVSHELKTPLATLELTSSLLKKETQGLSLEDQANLWRSHEEELQRLKRQVDDLLMVARLQSPLKKKDLPQIQFESWIQKASDRWKDRLGVDSELKVEGDPLEFQIGAEEPQLELIFENLIENSKKFALQTPQVQILKKRSKTHWSISILDQGCGFPKDQSKKIFSRFYRAPHGSAHSIPGSGLGLYICKTATQALGWRIQAKSSGLGKGSEFMISGRIPS